MTPKANYLDLRIKAYKLAKLCIKAGKERATVPVPFRDSVILLSARALVDLYKIERGVLVFTGGLS